MFYHLNSTDEGFWESDSDQNTTVRLTLLPQLINMTFFMCTNSNYKKKTLTFSTIIEQKKVKVVKPILTIWDDTQALYNTCHAIWGKLHNGNIHHMLLAHIKHQNNFMQLFGVIYEKVITVSFKVNPSNSF